jgi:hypothetical protein
LFFADVDHPLVGFVYESVGLVFFGGAEGKAIAEECAGVGAEGSGWPVLAAGPGPDGVFDAGVIAFAVNELGTEFDGEAAEERAVGVDASANASGGFEDGHWMAGGLESARGGEASDTGADDEDAGFGSGEERSRVGQEGGGGGKPEKLAARKKRHGVGVMD